MATKDAYYFSHDCNARSDEKILMLRYEYGWYGYGLYWALIEMMFEDSNARLSLSRLQGIACGLNITSEELNKFIDSCVDIGLFNKDSDYFWSDSLLRRKQLYLESVEKRSEHGKKAAYARWYVAPVMPEHSPSNADPMHNDANKRKENKGNKLKKENNSTTNSNNIFEAYEKNIGVLYPMAVEQLKDMEQEYPVDWIIEAIQLSVKSNATNLRYIEGILKSWKANGKNNGGNNGKHKESDKWTGLPGNKPTGVFKDVLE